MNNLNSFWKPNGADCFTWFALDAVGQLAAINNNGRGVLPACLLNVEAAERKLLDLADYLYEESVVCQPFASKAGNFHVNFYSSWFFREMRDKKEVEATLALDLKNRQNLSEASLAANKGLFVFEALDQGNTPGEIAIGYPGELRDGDYYKFLSPTRMASIEEIPKEFWDIIVCSDKYEFSRMNEIEALHVNLVFNRIGLQA